MNEVLEVAGAATRVEDSHAGLEIERLVGVPQQRAIGHELIHGVVDSTVDVPETVDARCWRDRSRVRHVTVPLYCDWWFDYCCD